MCFLFCKKRNLAKSITKKSIVKVFNFFQREILPARDKSMNVRVPFQVSDKGLKDAYFGYAKNSI